MVGTNPNRPLMFLCACTYSKLKRRNYFSLISDKVLSPYLCRIAKVCCKTFSQENVESKLYIDSAKKWIVLPTAGHTVPDQILYWEMPKTMTGIERVCERYLPLLWPEWQSGAALEPNTVFKFTYPWPLRSYFLNYFFLGRCKYSPIDDSRKWENKVILVKYLLFYFDKMTYFEIWCLKIIARK